MEHAIHRTTYRPSPSALAEILANHRAWLGSSGKEGARADLAGADLAGADLAGKMLERANLSRANLAGANLAGAQMAGCDLTWATLTHARMSGAHLAGAHLPDADLANADLRNVDFSMADLTDADLRGAQISGVVLTGTDLTGTCFTNAPETQDGTLDAAYEAEEVAPVEEVEPVSELYDADQETAEESAAEELGEGMEIGMEGWPGERQTPVIPPAARPAAPQGGLFRAVAAAVPQVPFFTLFGRRMEGQARPETPAREVPGVEEALHHPARLAYEMDDKALSDALKGHRRWVDSNELEGWQADLRLAALSGRNLAGAKLQRAAMSGVCLKNAELWETDLSRAELYDADLSGANLINANLEEAHLPGADLTGADLRGANLRHADLARVPFSGTRMEGTDLRGANLIGADLAGARRLTANSLAGADLTSAHLPPEMAGFGEGVAQVDLLARMARRVMVMLLLGCAYLMIALGGHFGMPFLAHGEPLRLPLLGTSLPAFWVYLGAPLVVLYGYLHLHVYLQRLWEALARLPAVFPDGRPLDQVVQPWLVTGLAAVYVPRLAQRKQSLFRLQEAVAIFLAYWSVPALLAMLWGAFFSIYHALLAAVATGFGVYAWLLARRTLKGK